MNDSHLKPSDPVDYSKWNIIIRWNWRESNGDSGGCRRSSWINGR